jgi:hypothetical protein
VASRETSCISSILIDAAVVSIHGPQGNMKGEEAILRSEVGIATIREEELHRLPVLVRDGGVQWRR